jgi:AraC-like DNA-binding protein
MESSGKRTMPICLCNNDTPGVGWNEDRIICGHGFWWFVSYSQRRTVCLDPLLRQSFWNVSELSRSLSLGRRTLSRIVARSVGRTAKVWLREHRINTACHLLREGGKIEAISTELGFHHHSAFTHEFKTVVGVTPSVYLRTEQARSEAQLGSPSKNPPSHEQADATPGSAKRINSARDFVHFW